VLTEISAAGATGMGYTYSDRAAAALAADTLAGVLHGRSAFAVRDNWHAMIHATRNLGRPGIVSSAVAACDIALHDLQAKLLGAPLAAVLGLRRPQVPVYGSGGFTSYSEDELAEQLGGWAADGFPAVKMKTGRAPGRDIGRVARARKSIGPATDLLVDANGAYDRKQALRLAGEFAACGVSWFEEPVSSNDVEGLRLIRDRGPAGMEIAAGEYGYQARYFLDLAAAGAVDVLQADATRCAGLTGFLLADAIAHATELPLSSHTAPAAHLHAGCAALQLRHVEWFHDHVRIERMLFDGAPEAREGRIAPDLSRPGLGLELKRADAERYRM
jgi:L-alanine-DL-glutamate epimerase-like enolase superfamily enzyme